MVGVDTTISTSWVGQNKELLTQVFSASATVITFAMFASGMPTMASIIKKRDAAGIPYIPWLAQIINCIFWLKYGILTANNTVIGVNSFGAMLDVVYLSIVYSYSKSSVKALLFVPYLSTMAIIVSVLGYVQAFLVEKEDAIFFAGIVCSSASMVMFASPLLGVVEVVRKKSTASMLFGQSALFFACSLSWSLFGYFINDPVIVTPNVVGCVFASIQMGLFVIYPSTDTLYSTGIVRG